MKIKLILAVGIVSLSLAGLAQAAPENMNAPEYAKNPTPDLVNKYCLLMGVRRAMKIADQASRDCADIYKKDKMVTAHKKNKMATCVQDKKEEFTQDKRSYFKSQAVLNSILNSPDQNSFDESCKSNYIQGLDDPIITTKESLKSQLVETLELMKAPKAFIGGIRKSF